MFAKSVMTLHQVRLTTTSALVSFIGAEIAETRLQELKFSVCLKSSDSVDVLRNRSCNRLLSENQYVCGGNKKTRGQRLNVET